MKGMSEREYAAHSGLSRGGVQKARKNGRLVVFDDGSINAAASDVRRAEMTDPDQQRRSIGGDVRRNFPFGGILFEEYSGTVTLSTKATERLVPANEGIAFPLGTMDTFTTYGGPANLLETANTIGLPLYARQHLDEKGRWIDVMTEASILPVNKRPRLAVRIHSSN